MLLSSKDTDSDDSGGEAKSQRTEAIFPDDAIVPGSANFSNITPISATGDSVDHNKQVTVCSDAAERCATMVLYTIFDSMSLEPGDTYPPFTAASKPDLAKTCKKLLKDVKSDAYLLSKEYKYPHSLSQSVLMELKRNIVKSDFKLVQDPLSASKLRKNFDYHPCHSTVFDLSCLDSSRYIYKSVISYDDDTCTSLPLVLFPSIRYAFSSMHLLLKL